jgi:hypothetical protein
MLLINGVKRLGFIGGIFQKFVGYCLMAVLLVFAVLFGLRKAGSSDYFGTGLGEGIGVVSILLLAN